MDRQTVYFGEVLRDVDFLLTNRNPLVGLAKLSEALLGTSTVVQGFPLSATNPISLNLTLGAGQVYEQEPLEATQWGSLAPDSHVIVKQGLANDAQNLVFVPPSGNGQAQVFLVQVQYIDADTGSVVLPYYNANNPSQPYSGPGNAGTAQNTVRSGGVAVNIKPGTAAAAGSQVAPTPDAGWAGLYLVTLTTGQQNISAGNISTYINAPFIPVTLPGVPSGVQSGKWVFGIDTGSADALNVSLSPTPVQVTTGFGVRVLKGNSQNATTNPTLTLTTTTGPQVFNLVKNSGAAVSAGDFAGNTVMDFLYDGTNFRRQGFCKSDIINLISAASSGLGVANNGGISKDGSNNLYLNYDNAPTGTAISDTDKIGVLSKVVENSLPSGTFFAAVASDWAKYVFSKMAALTPTTSKITAYKASTTVTPTPGYRTAKVTLTASGGGGGGNSGGNSGPGGGAGETSIKIFNNWSTQGATSYVQGSAGVGGLGSISAPSGQSAGNSTFGPMSAGGGQGGVCVSGQAGGTGGFGGSGGSGGDLQIPGGPGQSSSSGSGNPSGGNGGGSFYGGGGLGAQAFPSSGPSVINGFDATTYGCGGGGSDGGSSANGGAGAAGILLVEEFT